eukprot:TRINITY_DN16192_c0_g1_i1.p1 TRINITY_DN16192_c0_g1~~TRINITY_DN16192_c0_g1_i1.p1  ORF type:complete len:126 (-),score=9.20 TRINITY_DN16192_c0_g1_i1:10-387(-)
MHKPRGSSGAWQQIEKYQRIRVDKKTGKKLMLKLRSNTEVNLNSLTLELICNGEKMSSGYVIESREAVVKTKRDERREIVFKRSAKLFLKVLVSNCIMQIFVRGVSYDGVTYVCGETCELSLIHI